MAASVLKSLTLPIKDSLPPPTKELLYFEESDMVSTILQRFRTAGVTSAPVRRDGIFVGLIEITDLVHLLADICQRPKTSHVSPPSVSVEQDDMDQLLQRSTEFKVSTIGGSLSDRIKQRPFVTIAETAPFSELIALFSAQSNSGSSSPVHRVAVVPPGTERLTTITRMVSQSDIAGFLVRHPSIFELSLKTPLSWMPMRAVCIAEENPVMQAVRTMHASNLSAVGVVDARGHLRNVFSASDLKNLMISWTMSELQTPIREFLLQRKEKHSPVTCVPTDTVSTALYRTTKFRVHRVVVVDEAGTPLGILSLTDLLHITVTATDQK